MLPRLNMAPPVSGVGGLFVPAARLLQLRGSTWSASRKPRLNIASVLPALAACSYQRRAFSSCGGSTWSASRKPRVEHRVGVAAVGGLFVPAARLLQLRGI